MNYLETLKNISKDKQKRVENLVFLVILLVILLVSVNFIFKDNKKTSDNAVASSDEKTAEQVASNNVKSDLESKLSDILSKISGISEVSVLVTYSQDSKQNVVYNTKEQEKNGEKSTEKSVAYNEESGSKKAVVESVEMPKVEGAIIVAKGATTVEIKSKIASTVSSVTNIPVYKVQVFEKQG